MYYLFVEKEKNYWETQCEFFLLKQDKGKYFVHVGFYVEWQELTRQQFIDRIMANPYMTLESFEDVKKALKDANRVAAMIAMEDHMKGVDEELLDLKEPSQ